MRKALGLGALCAASALLVGCGSSEPADYRSARDPSSTDRNPGLYDPCDIPDEAVAAAGADPASEKEDFFGVQRTGWELCSWDAGWHYLTVLSTTHSFDEVTADPRNIELTPVDTIPGRDSATYRKKRDVNREKCAVAFAFADGTLIVESDTKGGIEAQELPCVMAVRGAVALNDLLPQ